jgi:hypothetical protein
MAKTIDIPIPLDLQALMQLPSCEDVRLPKPAPMKVQLPTGSSISAVADISKGIPTDCAMGFSLLLQVGPLLGSMECLLKILKLLKPLIDVIKGLPFPPVKAINDFIAAAADLSTCLLIPTPANLLPFIRDILCLILRMLKCIIGGLKTIVDLMSGLQLQLKVAIEEGNTELQKQLECAQENAANGAAHLMGSMEALAAILALIEPVMGLAGLEPFKLPALGDASDVEGLKKGVEALQGVADSLETVTAALGGCGS